MHSKKLKGFGSEWVLSVAARSKQLHCKVQLQSYFHIRVWHTVGLMSHIKSGNLSADIHTIVTDMNAVMVEF